MPSVRTSPTVGKSIRFAEEVTYYSPPTNFGDVTNDEMDKNNCEDHIDSDDLDASNAPNKSNASNKSNVSNNSDTDFETKLQKVTDESCGRRDAIRRLRLGGSWASRAASDQRRRRLEELSPQVPELHGDDWKCDHSDTGVSNVGTSKHSWQEKTFEVNTGDGNKSPSGFGGPSNENQSGPIACENEKRSKVFDLSGSESSDDDERCYEVGATRL